MRHRGAGRLAAAAALGRRSRITTVISLRKATAGAYFQELVPFRDCSHAYGPAGCAMRRADCTVKESKTFLWLDPVACYIIITEWQRS